MKIVVLAGGLSNERDVSFSSGTMIANALIENGHEVMLMDLYLGEKNKDFPLKYYTKKDNFKYTFKVDCKEPDLNRLKRLKGNDSLMADNLITVCKDADFVFLALHGSIGENGVLQDFFDKNHILYTGSSPLGCSQAMNKSVSKMLMRKNNILTPDSILIKKNSNIDYNDITYPCVVKPCSNGSSVGISMVEDEKELKNAIKKALKYEDEILIEKRIFGRELTVGILNNKALPVIEIIPKSGFYDYTNKYQIGLTDELCPAPISDKLTQKIQQIALDVHHALSLGNYSRIDFIMDNEDNIYCLEANTLPGMTPTSLLPLAAKTAGISYNKLCEIIINSSNKR